MGFILDMSDAAGPFHIEARSKSFYLGGEHNFVIVGGTETEPDYAYQRVPHGLDVRTLDSKQVEVAFAEEDLDHVLAALDDLCVYLDEQGDEW